MQLPIFALLAAATSVVATATQDWGLDARDLSTDSSLFSERDSVFLSERDEVLDRAHMFIRSLQEEHDLTARELLAEILAPVLMRRGGGMVAPQAGKIPGEFGCPWGCTQRFTRGELRKHVLDEDCPKMKEEDAARRETGTALVKAPESGSGTK